MTDPLTEQSHEQNPTGGDPPLGAVPVSAVAPPCPPIPVLPPLPAIPVAPPRRFCNTCGEPADPVTGGCPRCATRTAGAGPLYSRGSMAAPDEGSAIAPALGLYFAYLATSAVGLIVAAQPRTDPVGLDFGLSIAASVLVIAWAGCTARLVAGPLTTLGRLPWYPLAAGAAIATFALASTLVWAFSRLLDQPPGEMTNDLAAAGYGLPTMVLLIAVQPAVIEELAFRGVIFGALRRALNPGETIVVSAMMFTILHLSIASFPHLLVIGLALGYLRHRTGSIYPCVLLHFCHNLLCVLAERWKVFPVW
ncbi:MAG TPA: type II CAAX endopeptidase family protein [Tepidisphaeraceae bacterium]|nr:type II CAAX endopeptidase family protein [Tepidisphaeraceae bacterium]